MLNNMSYSIGTGWKLPSIIGLGILIAFSNLIFLSTLVFADDLNPGIFSKDSKPFDVPYGDWLAKYSQWFINFPAESHPREHYTSDSCSLAQSGPVWFLTDTLAGNQERTCIIPSDKAVLLPVLDGRCWSDTTDPIPMNDQDITNCAKAGNEYGLISASIDGREIKDLDSYRAESPFFNITVPENNIYNNVPGIWKAKADGFFVFLEPLSPGNHTLHTKVSVLNPTSPESNYAATLTYHLVVKS
jgi:hypothetical protein